MFQTTLQPAIFRASSDISISSYK